MNTSCPTCGKPVDPLRSRNVGVRDGKVVAYDSAECAAAAETRPTAIPSAHIPSAHRAATRTPATGIPSGKTPSFETGPVIVVVKDAPPVQAAPAKRTDATLKKWAVEEGAEVPDPDRSGMRAVSDPTESAPRKLGPLLILAVVLVVAAVYVGYRVLLGGSTTDEHPAAPAPEPPTTVKPPPPPAEAPRFDAGAVLEQATAVLRGNMAAATDRVPRLAAIALARTKDPAAMEMLATALASEKMDAGRLELGYALARAGDERGKTVLVAFLRSERRDPKLQAGRMLALLGDKQGADRLAPYLSVVQTRLGAAESMAYVRDERALKVLDAIRADAKALGDDKARATIALGIAGRTEVIPDLQALLKNEHFKAQAAGALAKLGDPTARAVLAEQLAIVQLRVDTARALRQLEPALDPTPFLTDIVAGLQSKKDTEQVSSAEAILILAGDPAWSEYP